MYVRPSLSGGLCFFIAAPKKAMLLASAHMMALSMTRQVKPFLLSRTVCTLPSMSMRATPAPLATPGGAAVRAFAMYAALDELDFWAGILAGVLSCPRAKPVIAKQQTAPTKLRVTSRILPP